MLVFLKMFLLLYILSNRLRIKIRIWDQLSKADFFSNPFYHLNQHQVLGVVSLIDKNV